MAVGILEIECIATLEAQEDRTRSQGEHIHETAGPRDRQGQDSALKNMSFPRRVAQQSHSRGCTDWHRRSSLQALGCDQPLNIHPQNLSGCGILPARHSGHGAYSPQVTSSVWAGVGSLR